MSISVRIRRMKRKDKLCVFENLHRYSNYLFMKFHQNIQDKVELRDNFLSSSFKKCCEVCSSSFVGTSSYLPYCHNQPKTVGEQPGRGRWNWWENACQDGDNLGDRMGEADTPAAGIYA